MTTSLLAGSGVVALFVGLASQEAMANLVGGLMLYVNRPFAVGDRINLPGDGLSGVVEEITMRHTVLSTIGNTRVIVPNSKLNTATLENFSVSEGPICNFLEVSVAYDADLDKAISIMQRAMADFPACMDRRSEEDKQAGKPIAGVTVTALKEYGCDLRGVFWTATRGEGYEGLAACRLRVKKEFDEAGINWPRSTVNVHNKN